MTRGSSFTVYEIEALDTDPVSGRVTQGAFPGTVANVLTAVADDYDGALCPLCEEQRIGWRIEEYEAQEGTRQGTAFDPFVVIYTGLAAWAACAACAYPPLVGPADSHPYRIRLKDVK